MKRHKRTNSNIAIYIVLIFAAVIMVMPFVWTFLTSFKTQSEAVAVPLQIFPSQLRIESYVSAWQTLPFANFFFNTFFMMFFRCLGSVIFSSMAGYSFARLDFPLKNFWFIVVMIQMMVPGQIFILPQYLIVAELGWLDTLVALVVPGIVSTFGTFLMRQFFLGIPKDLEEAAALDGCNPLKLFTSVMLPLARSGMISLTIFTALFAWKDLMWPLIINISPNKMTLSAGLSLLNGQYTVNYPELMAGSIITIVPMLILFLLFQKQFISGIATTGSKG